jgi:hypothetical protein
MIQFIGLIIAGYCSVRMFELITNSNTDKFIKIIAVVNLIATIFFTLMILVSSAKLPQY